MKRSLAILCAFLLTGTAAHAGPLPLERGIGVHEWLNWAPLDGDGTYRQPPYYTIEEWLGGYRPLSDWPQGDEFERIRGFGFDFVRLTVDPGPMLASAGARRAEALAVLERAIEHILASGLSVVFNYHPNSQVRTWSPASIEGDADSPEILAYSDMVVETARMLDRIGADRVAIEPFNEPAYYPCGSSSTDEWQKIMDAQVRAIRAVARDLTIVATGACGGGVNGLLNLDPRAFDDPAILYSFHMYEPHSFTHQRLEDGWASGLPWPVDVRDRDEVEAWLADAMEAAGVGQLGRQANRLRVAEMIEAHYAAGWDEARMEARFAEAVDWAHRHGVAPERLFMGEFGVIAMPADGARGAFDADRIRYLDTVRRLAEGYGMAWSFWEYSNPHGMTFILADGPARPDAVLLAPLGLEPAGQ